jgi:hypothetical protein
VPDRQRIPPSSLRGSRRSHSGGLFCFSRASDTPPLWCFWVLELLKRTLEFVVHCNCFRETLPVPCNMNGQSGTGKSSMGSMGTAASQSGGTIRDLCRDAGGESVGNSRFRCRAEVTGRRSNSVKQANQFRYPSRFSRDCQKSRRLVRVRQSSLKINGLDREIEGFVETSPPFLFQNAPMGMRSAIRS